MPRCSSPWQAAGSSLPTLHTLKTMTSPHLNEIHKQTIRVLACVERIRKVAQDGQQLDADTLRDMRLSAEAVKTATFALLEAAQ